LTDIIINLTSCESERNTVAASYVGDQCIVYIIVYETEPTIHSCNLLIIRVTCTTRGRKMTTIVAAKG